ncbi:hypothetical protein PMAYCL1PPCAC_17289, partial [Pristionchus mayeri]
GAIGDSSGGVEKVDTTCGSCVGGSGSRGAAEVARLGALISHHIEIGGVGAERGTGRAVRHSSQWVQLVNARVCSSGCHSRSRGRCSSRGRGGCPEAAAHCSSCRRSASCISSALSRSGALRIGEAAWNRITVTIGEAGDAQGESGKKGEDEE